MQGREEKRKMSKAVLLPCSSVFGVKQCHLVYVGSWFAGFRKCVNSFDKLVLALYQAKFSRLKFTSLSPKARQTKYHIALKLKYKRFTAFFVAEV